MVWHSRDLGNGILKAGQGGNSKYNYVWPTLVYAPRTGVAYDVTGNQHVVILSATFDLTLTGNDLPPVHLTG